MSSPSTAVAALTSSSWSPTCTYIQVLCIQGGAGQVLIDGKDWAHSQVLARGFVSPCLGTGGLQALKP
jgi:hypothetical protein